MDGLQSNSFAPSKTGGKNGVSYPFGELTPDVGETLEIMPGLHWARMPLPFSLKFINVWLIDEGDHWTVIDTGMPLDDTKAAWRAIIENTFQGRPISRVIATHMHPDHVGNAGWLCRKFPGAELWMSRLEYVSCRMLIADTGREAPEVGLRFYQRAGWNKAQVETYRSRFGGFGRAVSRMPDSYRRLGDGDVFEMGGETWTVLIARGHSPEHACLYNRAKNVLVAGDQILPRISSNVSVFPTEPEANPLADWLESCERLREILPENVLVLPGHNEPFRGAHTRLTHLIDGHEVALSRLLRKLETPQTVVDTFTSLFARKIGDDVIGMATGEAIAHLNLLRARGLVERETGADGIDRYVAV